MKPSQGAKFILRIDKKLHERLALKAKAQGISLNAQCQRLLAQGVVLNDHGAEERLAILMAAQTTMKGVNLLAVAVFGSWARQDAFNTSDVDVLLVVDSKTKIQRHLYETWDEQNLTIENHPLQPSMVQLPSFGKTVSGFWAEVAMDGIVLWDNDLQLTKYLVWVRREIAKGRLRQMQTHGQNYWVHELEKRKSA